MAELYGLCLDLDTYSIHGVYKPNYNVWGPHIVGCIGKALALAGLQTQAKICLPSQLKVCPHSKLICNMGISINGGSPKWMVCFMENPTKNG